VFKHNPIFGYDYEGRNIEWQWNVRPLKKIFWKTWKPKLENVKLLNVSDTNEYKIIQKKLYDEIIEKEHSKRERLSGIYKIRK
tara:strand:- start:811 stop:1059 length:249 start_codon:yes stop_codon:yes gene_type:complete